MLWLPRLIVVVVVVAVCMLSFLVLLLLFLLMMLGACCCYFQIGKNTEFLMFPVITVMAPVWPRPGSF